MIEELAHALPDAREENIALFTPIIVEVMDKYNVNTPLRKAHYIAQMGHETGQLRYREEIASGAAYEWRRDLGNVQKGDGQLFKGRGHGMLTGRYNYTKYDEYREGKRKYILHPELVAEEDYTCADTWGWYWDSKNLNHFADKDSILTITRAVNGGYNGLEDRKRLLVLAKQAFGVSETDDSPEHRIQRLLVKAGYDLVIDGIIGKQTKIAVIAFQRSHGLVSDGVVGPITNSILEKYDG